MPTDSPPIDETSRPGGPGGPDPSCLQEGYVFDSASGFHWHPYATHWFHPAMGVYLDPEGALLEPSAAKAAIRAAAPDDEPPAAAADAPADGLDEAEIGVAPEMDADDLPAVAAAEEEQAEEDVEVEVMADEAAAPRLAEPPRHGPGPAVAPTLAGEAEAPPAAGSGSPSADERAAAFFGNGSAGDATGSASAPDVAPEPVPADAEHTVGADDVAAAETPPAPEAAGIFSHAEPPVGDAPPAPEAAGIFSHAGDGAPMPEPPGVFGARAHSPDGGDAAPTPEAVGLFSHAGDASPMPEPAGVFGAHAHPPPGGDAAPAPAAAGVSSHAGDAPPMPEPAGVFGARAHPPAGGGAAAPEPAADEVVPMAALAADDAAALSEAELLDEEVVELADDAVPAPPPAEEGPAPLDPAEIPVRFEDPWRVVLHLCSGAAKRGELNGADLGTSTVVLHHPGGTDFIDTEAIKAIFFMKEAHMQPRRPAGRRVRLTFSDGRTLEGFAPQKLPASGGFYLVPLDDRTNTAWIFVYPHAIKDLAFA